MVPYPLIKLTSMKVEVTLKDLIRIDVSRLDKARLMLARSFQDDPMWSYFIPETSKRHRMMLDIFAVHLRTAFKFGEVYATSPNLEGVAVWIPSKIPENVVRRLFTFDVLRVLWIYFRLGIRSLIRINRVGWAILKVQKRQAPSRYLYLSPLAVDPRFQGQGYASRLMKPMLDRLEVEKMPCYLETQTERNVAIYEHFGFRVMEKVEIPGTGLTLWAMLK